MFSNRMRPHFLIIGGVKCASTSMFRYLIEHPNILPGSYKEPAFFNHRSLLKAWLTFPIYLRNFPLRGEKKSVTLNWAKLSPEGKVIDTVIEQKVTQGIEHVTGEASATYNHAANPAVIKQLLPNVKIIFLVRNPTERFISHYNMFRRFEREGRKGFDVGDLTSFVEKEIEANQSNKPTRLIHQGLYHDLVNKWKKYFDEHQFLLRHNEELNHPDKAHNLLNEVTSFLDLPEYDYSAILSKKYNVAPKKEVNGQAAALLNEFYREPNQLFFRDFKIDFSAND